MGHAGKVRSLPSGLVFGYEAFAADDYSGPSASLGIELAGFE
jgi:hypothetical protein